MSMLIPSCQPIFSTMGILRINPLKEVLAIYVGPNPNISPAVRQSGSELYIRNFLPKDYSAIWGYLPIH